MSNHQSKIPDKVIQWEYNNELCFALTEKGDVYNWGPVYSADISQSVANGQSSYNANINYQAPRDEDDE